MLNDPTRDELIAHLDKHGYSEAAGYMEFDREAAIYWLASDWHGGQGSNLYSVLSTSPYSPGPLCNGIKHEGEIAEIIYKELEGHFLPL